MNRLKQWWKKETEGMMSNKSSWDGGWAGRYGSTSPDQVRACVAELHKKEDQAKVDRARKIMTDPPAPGIRHDAGKLMWHLLPVPALVAFIKVWHGGAVKYAEDQWRGGMKFSRVYRSMISHFLKWLASNNSYDKELGTHHLMMVAWGCFVLYMYEVVYKFTDYDDRPEKGMLTDEDFEFVMGMLATNQSTSDEEDSCKDFFGDVEE